MPKKKKIVKPWCVYRHGTPTGVGKIVEINGKTSVSILYSEGQHYSPDCWDIRSIQRFATITAAIKKFSKYSGCTLEELKSVMMLYFPSKAKEIAKIRE